MSVNLRSYAKINIGLKIGRRRGDGFHELRTLYTTIAMSERVRVEVAEGEGITVHCKDPGCLATRPTRATKLRRKPLRHWGEIELKANVSIEKELPVQGGLGAASGNAVATILGLENALSSPLTPQIRAKIASEIGSDLNLFLYGGLVLGTGRGEEVWPLPDLPSLPLVVVTPEVGIVSTPKAFEDWDRLTPPDGSDTIKEFNRAVYAWLDSTAGSGVPALSGDRAGDTASRPCPNRDFERLRTRCLSRNSRITRGQKRAHARRRGVCVAFRIGIDPVWVVPNQRRGVSSRGAFEREWNESGGDSDVTAK